MQVACTHSLLSTVTSQRQTATRFWFAISLQAIPHDAYRGPRTAGLFLLQVVQKSDFNKGQAGRATVMCSLVSV